MCDVALLVDGNFTHLTCACSRLECGYKRTLISVIRGHNYVITYVMLAKSFKATKHIHVPPTSSTIIHINHAVPLIATTFTRRHRNSGMLQMSRKRVHRVKDRVLITPVFRSPTFSFPQSLQVFTGLPVCRSTRVMMDSAPHHVLQVSLSYSAVCCSPATNLNLLFSEQGEQGE